MTDGKRTPRRRLTPPALWTVLAVVLLNWAALGLTIALVPGISADDGWAVLLAAALLGLFGAVLRPAMAALLGLVGWLGVLAGWLFCQAVLVYLALVLTPGLRVDDFWSAFGASWIYAALMSVGLWLVTAGQPGTVTRHLLWVNRRHRRAAPVTDAPGVVMIQIDGLSAPLARWAIASGSLPTLGRWLRSGSHTLTEWHAQLPATTPASQAGLLHGASAQVPAFRWYEKDSGRLVVTNHPRDSALVESRLTDGRGLLADQGVSVSNVFSGDAPTSLLTMSTVGSRWRANRPARYLSTYLIDPFGLTRSLFLTIGEVVKELHQARRQRLRRVAPRIPRHASYVALRGITNVLLRHLNLSIIAEHMMRGAPSIYCDFVDYDEIAHHAGPARPEALAALEGIDDVLAALEEMADTAPRPYQFVVLSDHGQSQGATFRQQYGTGIDDLVRRFAAAPESPSALAPSASAAPGQQAVTAERHTAVPARRVPASADRGADSAHRVVAEGDDEQAGRARALRAELLSERGTSGDGEAPPERPEFMIAASGNLAMVYLARHPGRMTLEQIEARYPELLAGLVGHPGIGWVMVRSGRHGPVVLGDAGRRILADGVIEGMDPLVGCGPAAAGDLRRHDTLPHVGDILLNSAVDPETGEVAAFEELVGCHGGLGGWQNRPVLMYPAAWPVDFALTSADAVHRQLVRWLELLGQRTALRQPVQTAPDRRDRPEQSPAPLPRPASADNRARRR